MTERVAAQDGAAADGATTTPKIHVPEPRLGDGAAEPEPVSENGAEREADDQPKPKKKTRRGSRGGRNRRKKTPASANGGETQAEEPASDEYVPMSEWIDEVDRR